MDSRKENSELLQNTLDHFGLPHLHVLEAFVEQGILEWTLLLFSDMQISGPVFCSLAENSVAGKAVLVKSLQQIIQMHKYI